MRSMEAKGITVTLLSTDGVLHLLSNPTMLKSVKLKNSPNKLDNKLDVV